MKLTHASEITQSSNARLNTVLEYWPVALVILSFVLSFQQLIQGSAIIVLGLCIYAFKQRKSLFKPESLSISAIDIGVVLVIIIELIAYTQSSLEFNSRRYLLLLFHVVITYYFIKKTIRPEHTKALFWGLSLIGLYWAIITVKSVYGMVDSMAEHGFSDLTLFRNAYSPLAGSNEWTMFLLILLPFPIVLFLRSKNLFTHIVSLASFALIGFCIVLEFSRGGYVAFVLFMLCVILGVFIFQRGYFRKLVLGLSISIFLIGAASMPQWQTVATTIKMNETVSQQRSIESRWQMRKVVNSSLKSDPLFGVGAFNFPLVFNSEYQHTVDQAPLVRVSSIVTQVATEKGVVGILMYLFVFLFILISSWRTLRSKRNRNDLSDNILIIGLAAILSAFVRELTLSSLLHRDFIFSLFSILLALQLSNLAKPKRRWQIGQLKFILILLPVFALGLLTGWHEISGRRITSENKKIRSALDELEFEKANTHSENVLGLIEHHPVPYLNLAASRKHNSTPNQEVNWENILSYSGDIDMVIADLEHAQTLEPRDETILFSLGFLNACKGNWTSALDYIEQAYKVDPTIVSYPLCIGIILEKMDKPQHAKTYYAKALILDPDIHLSHFYSAFLLRHPNAGEQIFRMSLTELANSNEPISTARLGALEYFNGDLDEALRNLESANTDLPSMNRPYFYLGAIALERGDTSTAISLWDKSHFIDLSDQLVNYNYGLLAASKDLPQAERLLKRALNSNTAEPFYYKRRLFYPKMHPYTNTILSKAFMEYFNPVVDRVEIKEALIEYR